MRHRKDRVWHWPVRVSLAVVVGIVLLSAYKVATGL